jgi:predicted permease
MTIARTIIPIFALIILGWAAKKKGFMPPEFLGPANRLIFYLAIPALVFRAIAKADFRAQFNPHVLVSTISSILVVCIIAWIGGRISRINRNRLGSFIQASLHGNIGYIAFAVAYYYLGNEGFVRASIIAIFVMILQNFLAVIALHVCAERRSLRENAHHIIPAILGNPVILSAITGIGFSLSSAPLPLIIDRSLAILSSLALPMALLLIGASLSFELMQSRIASILSAGMLKLLVLPMLGFLLFRFFNLPSPEYLPGLIILASPTATVTYVMANEMHGDPDFAVAAISASTMLSAITLSIWLKIAI